MNLKAVPLMLSMIPSAAKGVGLGDLRKIKAITRAAFPAVGHVAPETLANWLKRSPQSILLVDVRSPAEFAVSHLRGAVNLRKPAEILRAIKERGPSKTVLYCAVGFRSSMLARSLVEKTECEILNLEGSIFEWANEGRPLWRGETEVRQVHPAGKRWAGLLREGLAAKLD